MSNFFKKIGSALKIAGIAAWSFLKTPFGASVTLLSILTVTSTVMLSVRLYEYTRIDEREIHLTTGLETELDLFAIEYKNESGEIVVSGTDGQKVIAPGTSVDYTVRLRNRDAVAINYELASAMETIGNYELPLKVRVIDPDDNYVLGSPTLWVPIQSLNEVFESDTLITRESAEYVFQWKWDYEGNDNYDTFLGNLATEEDVGLTVTLSVTATANTNTGINGGFFESGLGEIVAASVAIVMLGGSLALLLVPYIRKKLAEKRAR